MLRNNTDKPLRISKDDWTFCTDKGLWKLPSLPHIYTDDPEQGIEIKLMDNFVDTSKIFIREINKSVARDIIVKNHYTHAWTLCTVALGVFIKNEAPEDSFFEGDVDTLIGCIVFGNPIGRSAAASISPLVGIGEVLELTRLWVADVPNCKNVESYVIGQSFQWLRTNYPHIKALLSYADNEAGHTGIIYQSTNWLYQGNSQLGIMPNYSVSLTGPTEGYDWIHSRTVMSRWGSHNVDHLKRVLGKTFWRKVESSKHRYIYILATGKERKKIIKNLKHKTYPYPKSAKFDEKIEECFVDQTIKNGVNNIDAFLV